MHPKLLQSRLTLCDAVDHIHSPPGCSVHGNSPGKNTRVGCHALLQGIFPTQGSKLDLPHCRWILYQLSYSGSRIIKKSTNNKCWRECGDTLGGNVNWHSHYGKQYGDFLN